MIKAKIISVNQEAVDVTTEADYHAGRRITIPGIWSADLVITQTDLSFEEITTLYRDGTEFELVPDE